MSPFKHLGKRFGIAGPDTIPSLNDKLFLQHALQRDPNVIKLVAQPHREPPFPSIYCLSCRNLLSQHAYEGR